MGRGWLYIPSWDEVAAVLMRFNGTQRKLKIVVRKLQSVKITEDSLVQIKVRSQHPVFTKPH